MQDMFKVIKSQHAAFVLHVGLRGGTKGTELSLLQRFRWRLGQASRIKKASDWTSAHSSTPALWLRERAELEESPSIEATPHGPLALILLSQ